MIHSPVPVRTLLGSLFDFDGFPVQKRPIEFGYGHLGVVFVGELDEAISLGLLGDGVVDHIGRAD